MLPNPICLVSLLKEEVRTQTESQRRPCEDTRKNGHLQALEKGFGRNQPADTSASEFEPPEY